MHETDWLPGIIALALGLVGGLILWLTTRKKGAAPAQVHGHAAKVDDLRARKESLLDRLRELRMEIDAERDQLVVERLQREQQRLELEAASALRELQRAEAAQATPAGPGEAANGSQAAAPQPPGGGYFAQRPVLRGFLWGAGSTTFLFVLAFLLLDFLPGGSSFMARPEGGPMTGGDSVMADRARMEQADEELEVLRRRVVANPTDPEAKLDLAQALIFRDRLVDAFGLVQEVAQVAPNHPRALAYEGVVRLAMGQSELSLELLDRAVALDPKFTEAWVRRGLTAFEMGRYQLAIDSWEEALAQRPDGAPALQPVIDEARMRLEAGEVPKATASPRAHPEVGEPPRPAPARAEAGPGLRLRIDVDPAAAERVEPGSILFVSARPAGITSGPPLAAKRLTVEVFPVEVELTDADSMLGQPLPSRLSIEARIDSDGDPMTRDPDDPAAAEDGLEIGQPPADLVLR